MSTDTSVTEVHIECIDDKESVHKIEENGSSNETICDSGVETVDSCSTAFPSSSDSEVSPIKNILEGEPTDSTDSSNDEMIEVESSSLCTPISISPDDNGATENLLNFDEFPVHNVDETKDIVLRLGANINSQNNIDTIPCDKQNIERILASSTISLDDQKPATNIICKSPFSKSAENISSFDQIEGKSSLNVSDKELNADKILSEFTNHKNKVMATQKIPESINKPENIDTKHTRIPKEILSQDIGSIVKNVHGIFSSVSGSLMNAYTHRASVQKPVKAIKAIPNGKLMNDIFEDDNIKTDVALAVNTNDTEIVPNLNLECQAIGQDSLELDTDPKKDILRLQVEALEKVLAEQRKDNASLRDRVKQQMDELQEKDQAFKEFETKLDVMSKRADQAVREKDAAVMRYASVECAAIEARRAADTASRAEKAAAVEVELLNNKLKSAHSEKQRICQMYDDKCHEVLNTERELAKVRDDMKELEGRLKWTQSKLRMEIDAYKDTTERAEKLSQQVSELEAARDAAAANAVDSVRAKQLEGDLKESQAALILCRHEKAEFEKRLSSVTQQLDTCKRERDTANASLAHTTAEVEKLKISNFRLEEEAAELAALRAQAALADTLSAQLQRETERAQQAEEALSTQRALAETCARREAAALEHAATLTAHHVHQRAHTHHHEAKAQALEADNASLRERVTSLEEECERLRTALDEETDRRNKENKVLARKIAELTEEAAEANKKLEWEKGENGVLKKKHASAIKELNRELQRSLKRCEQLEAKLPPPDAPSTRTGSVSSLSSGEGTPHDDRLQNGHPETMPDIQVRSPDRQALIERIVSLQRAAARRAERCDFLEEHSRQLTAELRSKAKLLRNLLCDLPAGAVASADRDLNKKEIARLGGGAMAAVWGGDPAGITLELSLEMNKRLQAVLEDTLLKNITLKENMDTLGAEISRLKEQKKTTDAK